MKILTFSTPIDASGYIADFGPANGAALRRINYETGELRFSLVRPDGTLAEQVNAITSADPSEDTAAEEIRSALAATLPA